MLTLRPLPAPIPANPGSGQPPPPAPAPYAATSDASGKFSFQVPPGRYTFTAEHAGYATTFYSDKAAADPSVLILTAGQHIAELAIELAPQAVLSGTVTGDDGSPMAGVTVRPMRRLLVNGRIRIAAAGEGVQTDAGGQYQLTVAAGRWYLGFSIANPAAPARARRAAAPPGTPDVPERSYVDTYYPGATKLTLAQGIDAAAGQQLPGLDMHLRKTLVYHVRGEITGSLQGVSSARDTFHLFATPDGGESNPGVSDQGQPVAADGSFEFDGLAPGAWTLTVVRYAPGRESLGRQLVEIGDQNVEDVVIPVQPPADLRGSVRTVPQDPPGFNPSPQTVTPLQVRLTPLDALLNPAAAPVQNDGAFTVRNVEAGRYRVDFFPPPGAFVKSVIFAGQECIDSGIDVSNGAGTSSLRIVVSMTAGQIIGSVTDPGQGPPAVSYVTIVPEGPPPSPSVVYRPELHRTVQTDPSGQFAVNSVVPGKYRVYAWERLDTVDFADREFLKLFDDLSAVVTVTEDNSEQASLIRVSGAKMDEEARKRGH
jgi:hypothetical protein